LTVYGDGTQTRSLCYVDDLVDGLMRLMETDGLAGEVVNLGNPAEVTITEFAERVIARANSTSVIRHEPLPVDDPTRRRPDIAKARERLGWEPRVDLDAGLDATITYFREALTAEQ
jgi:UDP-glucuronate decarboxylase